MVYCLFSDISEVWKRSNMADGRTMYHWKHLPEHEQPINLVLCQFSWLLEASGLFLLPINLVLFVNAVSTFDKWWGQNIGNKQDKATLARIQAGREAKRGRGA